MLPARNFKALVMCAAAELLACHKQGMLLCHSELTCAHIHIKIDATGRVGVSLVVPVLWPCRL